MKSFDYWMQKALELADKAQQEQEVPVGAVVVCNNEMVGEGWNQPIGRCDPTAHAEILALRQAALKLNNYRLPNCQLYVTLEPCSMCLGALIQARIQHIVFGAWDPKAGAIREIKHQIDWQDGILEDPCSTMLKNFFKKRRKQQVGLDGVNICV